MDRLEYHRNPKRKHERLPLPTSRRERVGTFLECAKSLSCREKCSGMHLRVLEAQRTISSARDSPVDPFDGPFKIPQSHSLNITNCSSLNGDSPSARQHIVRPQREVLSLHGIRINKRLQSRKIESSINVRMFSLEECRERFPFDAFKTKQLRTDKKAQPHTVGARMIATHGIVIAHGTE